jgi:hypothetical protein
MAWSMETVYGPNFLYDFVLGCEITVNSKDMASIIYFFDISF